MAIHSSILAWKIPWTEGPVGLWHVGMVFQSFNLFNNMTVLENCMVGQIKVLKKDKEKAREDAIASSLVFYVLFAALSNHEKSGKNSSVLPNQTFSG